MMSDGELGLKKGIENDLRNCINNKRTSIILSTSLNLTEILFFFCGQSQNERLQAEALSTTEELSSFSRKRFAFE